MAGKYNSGMSFVSLRPDSDERRKRWHQRQERLWASKSGPVTVTRIEDNEDSEDVG